MKKIRKLLKFILEKKCRDVNEVLEFCIQELETTKNTCYDMLSKLARKKLITRYWVRDNNNRRHKRYCVESIEKIIERI